MTDTRSIRATDIVKDIRAGMTHPRLREPHQLSTQGLPSIFTKLVDAHAVKDGELNNRTQLVHNARGLDRKRLLSRKYVLLRLLAHGAEYLTVGGRVRDITEKGLQVAGLSVIVGDCKTLVLQADDFASIHPCALEPSAGGRHGKQARERLLPASKLSIFPSGPCRNSGI